MGKYCRVLVQLYKKILNEPDKYPRLFTPVLIIILSVIEIDSKNKNGINNKYKYFYIYEYT